MLWLEIRFILLPKLLFTKMVKKYSEDLSLVGPETVLIGK